VPKLLHRYHEIEPEVERDPPGRPYRQVLDVCLSRLAAEEGLELPAAEEDALSRSLPAWDAFPDVPAALADARARGWKLAILSNTDRDYIEASMATIGVPFELAIVASEIGSYKPAHGHWHAFRAAVNPDAHVHVGASLFHDVAPARELGLPTVWINRLGERPHPHPDVELHSLAGLADALDGLAP